MCCLVMDRSCSWGIGCRRLSPLQWWLDEILSFRTIGRGALGMMEWRQEVSGTGDWWTGVRGWSEMSDFSSPIPYASNGESRRWSPFVHNWTESRNGLIISSAHNCEMTLPYCGKAFSHFLLFLNLFLFHSLVPVSTSSKGRIQKRCFLFGIMFLSDWLLIYSYSYYFL